MYSAQFGYENDSQVCQVDRSSGYWKTVLSDAPSKLAVHVVVEAFFSPATNDVSNEGGSFAGKVIRGEALHSVYQRSVADNSNDCPEIVHRIETVKFGLLEESQGLTS